MVEKDAADVEQLDRAQDILVGALGGETMLLEMRRFAFGLALEIGVAWIEGNPVKVSKPMIRRWKLYGSRIALSLAKLIKPPPNSTPHSTIDPWMSLISRKIS